MRTDSVNLSETALKSAKTAIESMFGERYYQQRQYKTKSKGAQEAHEAIRPTYMENPSVDGSSAERRLYDLIWKRTLASQMADASLEKTTITIGISNAKEKFEATGEVLLFDGFLKVYIEGTDDENDDDTASLLPKVTAGEQLTSKEILATERFTQKPPRYSEASLVKKLEELGIGRPSTYAPTISTIITRGYVQKEDRPGVERTYLSLKLKGTKITEESRVETFGAEKSKLFPSDIGILVTDFLTKYFTSILSYDFTANVEKDFDKIAEGKVSWTNMFYNNQERFYRRKEIDTRKLQYEYFWIDLQQAANPRNRYNYDEKRYSGEVVNIMGEKVPITDRSSFIIRDVVNVYPDTLCWISDFTYSYNEPYTTTYFYHPSYDNYPVVGVTWKQATAFCIWRTQYLNDYLFKRGEPFVNDYRLPTESEWEYAARGGLDLNKYPWGGPYTRNQSGCFLANFKPLRGNYIDDGGLTTVPVMSYDPNDYGLYDMAGNVAEWTSNAYDESAYMEESERIRNDIFDTEHDLWEF